MRRAAVSAMIVAIGVCLYLTPIDRTVLARLYCVPVVVAALYDGWRGGGLRRFARRSHTAATLDRFLDRSALVIRACPDHRLLHGSGA